MSQLLRLATTDLLERRRIPRRRRRKPNPTSAGRRRRRRRRPTTIPAILRVTRTVPDLTSTRPSWIISTGKWPRTRPDQSETPSLS